MTTIEAIDFLGNLGLQLARKIIKKLGELLIIEGGHYIREEKGIPSSKEDILEKTKQNFTPDFPQGIIPEKVDIEHQPYLCLDGLIHKGEIAAIVSAPGVGKTFLGVDIAKSPYLEKVLYLELDDINGNQSKRFANLPKLYVIFAGQWKQRLRDFQEQAKAQIEAKVNWDMVLSSEARKTDRKERHQQEFGINKEKKID
jgi:hypothetical protein